MTRRASLTGTMPHKWGNPHVWHPQVGVQGARPRVRALRRRAGAHLLQVGKPHENSHLATAPQIRVRAGGALARSLLSHKDNSGWLRRSWPMGRGRHPHNDK